MGDDSIKRIRSATFNLARRGYDRREVDTFLSKLADWLESGGGDQVRTETVKRELERVGQRTSAILAAAEDSANELRAEAEAEARQVLGRANATAEKARADCEAHATEVRENAEREAAQALAAAEAKAERIVEEGTQRRRALETVIADLLKKRDAALFEADKISRELAAAAKQHRPTTSDGDPFAPQEELDPAARSVT